MSMDAVVAVVRPNEGVQPEQLWASTEPIGKALLRVIEPFSLRGLFVGFWKLGLAKASRGGFVFEGIEDRERWENGWKDSMEIGKRLL